MRQMDRNKGVRITQLAYQSYQ